MALLALQAMPRQLVLAIVIALLLYCLSAILAKRSSSSGKNGLNMIDSCWRGDPRWQRHRLHLAACSVGFAGKMTNNIGGGVTHYKVTDHLDDPLNPQPGMLCFGVTQINGKVWVTFQRDMQIKLEKPLLISSYTAIDG